ncbi:MAG: trypsin-like peptidase domain-containing protein [Pirellulaceae bacterium]
MLRRYIAAFAVLSFLIAPVEARLRFWTHAATKTRVQAELLEIKGQKIRILNPKGAQAMIAIDQLSDADQRYLKKLVSQKKAAEEAFKLGVDALKSGRYEEAKERFLKASKWNERDIKADFALGIYYIGYERKVQDAGEHFEVCVERWKSRIPQFTNIERVNYIAALNNSALVHVRRRQLDLAFQEWQTAIDIGHVTPQEIIQNLGTVARFATNVSANVTAFDVPLNQEERDGFKQLIETAVLPKDSKPYRPDVGWLYMTYMDESDLSDRTNDTADDALRTVGYATGFVIANGWILTNRHSVVKDDEIIPYDGFEAFFGPAYDQPVRVTLEDADSSYDLALLKFEPNSLARQPLPVFNGEANKSDSLMTCAFVKGADIDKAVTTSDGHILRLPASDVREGDRRFEKRRRIGTTV